MSDSMSEKFLHFPYDLENCLCIMEEYEWADLKIRISPEYMAYKEKPAKVLMEDFSKLMNDEDTADFTLKTKTKNFRIHKLIFGARSSVFKAMFQSNMVEALAGEVTIEDLDESKIQGTDPGSLVIMKNKIEMLSHQL